LPFVQPLRTILKIGHCRVVPELHLAPLQDVPSNLVFFTRPSFGGSGYETTFSLLSVSTLDLLLSISAFYLEYYPSPNLQLALH
jgi:hypothetical protein